MQRQSLTILLVGQNDLAATLAEEGQAALRQKFADLSVEPAPSSAEDFRAFIASETAKWRTVITSAGVSLGN